MKWSLLPSGHKLPDATHKEPDMIGQMEWIDILMGCHDATLLKHQSASSFCSLSSRWVSFLFVKYLCLHSFSL